MDWTMFEVALVETLYMTSFSLVFAVIIGFIIGVLIYLTKKGGLVENLIINRVLDVVVNVSRAIPFIILLYLLIPFTRMLVGTMIGDDAALPALIVSASPFYARMTLLALNEVSSGTIEACKSMGASTYQIVVKALIPEAKPALISGVAVLCISLIGYVMMAGAIGAGGLGNLAYLYGAVRNDNFVLYLATLLIVLIVFAVQYLGDFVVKKIDKR